ncbi:MAG: glycogen synthase GlgA [Gammaproteobacteria bacterium]|nr:glycogen synthase GlgA [Gammaproteobacteria bacterium]
MSKILFATSEAYPLIKTGGLADVSGSLPRALVSQKQDVRLILPAYADVMEKVGSCKTIASQVVDGLTVNILETRLPGTKVKTWLVDCPEYFDRPGNPYLDEHNEDWHDNAERFTLFCRVVVAVALNQLELNWQPDLVHCNDWQTGLVPALLDEAPQRPATLFTIHNMAYQGLFPFDTFAKLSLPDHFWHHETLEFHDYFSFMKGGLVYADSINAVSPTYAEEIKTPEFGYGLDGLLRYRQSVVSGILNGIDTTEWNPGTDKYLVQTYNRRTLSKKQINKAALQQHFSLPAEPDTLLLGFIGRLVEQKGVDDILQALPALMELPIQIAILGSGQPYYEQDFLDWAQRHPQKIAITVGYDEALAHQIEAGSDAFLMPSRFEPCGLNQLYSLRYGTLPVVRDVGGLKDTVTDSQVETLENNSATGIVFSKDETLVEAIQRLLTLYKDTPKWKQVQHNAMQQDNSWSHRACAYIELYEQTTGRNPRPVKNA